MMNKTFKLLTLLVALTWWVDVSVAAEDYFKKYAGSSRSGFTIPIQPLPDR